MTPEEQDWEAQQLKPLSMFEIAKWWADGLKVVGAGNGAGVLAAGAALGTLQGRGHSLIVLKFAGAAFLIGVLAFALAFFTLHVAMFAHDNRAHSLRKKNLTGIMEGSATSQTSMNIANVAALVSTIAFAIGCLFAFVVFIFAD